MLPNLVILSVPWLVAGPFRMGSGSSFIAAAKDGKIEVCMFAGLLNFRCYVCCYICWKFSYVFVAPTKNYSIIYLSIGHICMLCCWHRLSEIFSIKVLTQTIANIRRSEKAFPMIPSHRAFLLLKTLVFLKCRVRVWSAD